MQREDCFLLGRVFKLHGYKGDIKIYNDNDIILDFNTVKYFLIEKNNSLVPFIITKARRIKKNIILVKLKEINSEEEAFSILRKKIYLPTDFLPNIDKKKVFKKELIGFRVRDVNIGELGKISYINSRTPQELIYVSKDGKEFCFPMHKNFIININSTKKIMEVTIPEDIINLN
jgi:16S rRNA processing protein RimM